jgi:hypothetical protein
MWCSICTGCNIQYRCKHLYWVVLHPGANVFGYPSPLFLPFSFFLSFSFSHLISSHLISWTQDSQQVQNHKSSKPHNLNTSHNHNTYHNNTSHLTISYISQEKMQDSQHNTIHRMKKMRTLIYSQEHNPPGLSTPVATVSPEGGRPRALPSPGRPRLAITRAPAGQPPARLARAGEAAPGCNTLCFCSMVIRANDTPNYSSNYLWES